MSDQKMRIIQDSTPSYMEMKVNELLVSEEGWRVEAVSICPAQRSFITVLVQSKIEIEEYETCPLCGENPCNESCDAYEGGYF